MTVENDVMGDEVTFDDPIWCEPRSRGKTSWDVGSVLEIADQKFAIPPGERENEPSSSPPKSAKRRVRAPTRILLRPDSSEWAKSRLFEVGSVLLWLWESISRIALIHRRA